MIVDFARGDTPTRLATDLCIVGAGAAGIALALEFANTRTSALLRAAASDPSPTPSVSTTPSCAGCAVRLSTTAARGYSAARQRCGPVRRWS